MREDTDEMRKQDALIQRLLVAGERMKAQLEPRRVGFATAARESTEEWDRVVSSMANAEDEARRQEPTDQP